MKKLLSILLCVALLSGLAIPAFAEGYTVSGENPYAPPLLFLGDGEPSDPFCYLDDYFRHSGYRYDHELARMTMDLAMAAFGSENVPWPESNRNFVSLMRKCGFTDIEANDAVTVRPSPDSIGVNMALRQIDDATLLAVAIRGFNYQFEWASNFTIGSTGDHQGFAEARELTLDYIREYIASHGVTGRVKLWVTGYSRGAGVANLVGGALDQGVDLGENVSFGRNDLYCYTFGTPKGTGDPDCHAALYDNVHNIVNLNDIVAAVSPSAWGHERYGIDYRLPCRQLDGEEYYRLKPAVDEILENTECVAIGDLTLHLIDEFRYLSFDPLTTLRKQSITQLEFYQEFLDVLTEKMIPSRDIYVDTRQSDFREVGLILGSTPEGIPAVLQCFAEKLLAPDKLAELSCALIDGDKKACELVAALFMEAMGEKVHATNDSEQAVAMIYRISDRLVRLFETAPDTTLTLVANLIPILNAHMPEINRAWLDATPAEFFLAQGNAAYYEEDHVHAPDPARHHSAQSATCTAPGTVEYWECADAACTARLDANAQTLADITDPAQPATGHSFTVYTPDGNASCTADGTKSALCDYDCGAKDTVTDDGSAIGHRFAKAWSSDESGHWHAAVCGHAALKDGFAAHTDGDRDHKCDICGYRVSDCADSDENGACDLCGKAVYGVKLSVKCNVLRSLLFKLPLSCTYTLRPEVSGASVRLVQYSLDGGHIWLPGTIFMLPGDEGCFRVRILDSTGTWTVFSVRNGTEVTRK